MSENELDFSVVQPWKIGLDPKVVHRSSPSGDEYLGAVLRDLDITETDRIIDIGCGKGSAMSIMLGFPFESIAGVEISPILAKVAVSNFMKLKTQRCIVHVGDAQDFEGYNDFDYFYLYNPFPCEIMDIVLYKINSCCRGLRKRILIYDNPVCDRLVIQYGWTFVDDYPDKWDNGIFVYSRIS